MKIPTIALIALSLFSPLAAHSQSDQPHTVVHVVTVKWKAGTTPAQIEAALSGVKGLPSKYPGILRVWTKSVKVQGGKANAFVMEFADAAALKAYTDSPAQKDWYKTYLPIRDESSTFDITN